MDEKRSKDRVIFNTFWPLAISWLFMAVDNPAVSAVVSRMRDPEHCLAAHGGVIYPLMLIIESPVIMLISASIALCSDRKNFLRVRKLMLILCGSLSLVHILINVPSIFSFIFSNIMGAPEELYEYSRIDALCMIPWTAAIGYRRFYQGVLIRYGHSRHVTIGTMVRMFSMLSALFISLALRQKINGAAAAGVALCTGVICEAAYAGWQGHKVVRKELHEDAADQELISWKELSAFCIPLCLTSAINLGWMSIGSAAMSRMIQPIASLAVWPVLSGLLNIVKSFSNALNETSLSMVLRPGYLKPMKHFVIYVSLFCVIFLLLIAFTPLSELWFVRISALEPELAELCKLALPLSVLVAVFNGHLNFYQGVLMAKKQTRAIFEALVVFLAVMLVVIAVGIRLQRWQGIYVIMVGMSLAVSAQTLWTAFRAKKCEQELNLRS